MKDIASLNNGSFVFQRRLPNIMLPRPRRSNLSNRAEGRSQIDKIIISVLPRRLQTRMQVFLGMETWAKQGLGCWAWLQRSCLKISSASSAEQSLRTSFSMSCSAASSGPCKSALELACSFAGPNFWGSKRNSAQLSRIQGYGTRLLLLRHSFREKKISPSIQMSAVFSECKLGKLVYISIYYPLGSVVISQSKFVCSFKWYSSAF